PHIVRAFDTALDDVDVLLMPTCLCTAPRYEELAGRREALEDHFDGGLRTIAPRNTMPYNYTGHPALAVPVGKAAGLPVSMQLVRRFFDDALLLQVAYAYEHLVDWDAIIRIDA